MQTSAKYGLQTNEKKSKVTTINGNNIFIRVDQKVLEQETHLGVICSGDCSLEEEINAKKMATGPFW